MTALRLEGAVAVEEEGFFKANVVNEEDPERDRATLMQQTSSAMLCSCGRHPYPSTLLYCSVNCCRPVSRWCRSAMPRSAQMNHLQAPIFLALSLARTGKVIVLPAA